jgi:hypothetical protein
MKGKLTKTQLIYGLGVLVILAGLFLLFREPVAPGQAGQGLSQSGYRVLFFGLLILLLPRLLKKEQKK